MEVSSYWLSADAASIQLMLLINDVFASSSKFTVIVYELCLCIYEHLQVIVCIHFVLSVDEHEEAVWMLVHHVFQLAGVLMHIFSTIALLLLFVVFHLLHFQFKVKASVESASMTTEALLDYIDFC